jgi:hypothetical protein
MNKKPETLWQPDQPKDMRTRSNRRSLRMNCRVPVTMKWSSKVSGLLHFETGFTRVVNAYGCLLVSPKRIDLQQRLLITNLATRAEANAEVVWRGTQRPDGWDLGVKFIDSQLDFWGVDL